MTLSQVERTWFATRVPGQLSTTPLNDLKRAYYASQLGPSVHIHDLVDAEKQWLIKTIRDNAGTPAGNQLSDLWVQLLASAGLRVSKYMDENKTTYYVST